MSETVKKDSFIETLRRSRQAWEDALAAISKEERAVPGFAGEWSLKDVVAHIAWYEREMVGILRARRFVGSDLWEQELEARNAEIHALNALRLPADVFAEEGVLYEEMMALLDALDEQALNQAAAFPGMPAEWMPWEVIASNTYEHYDDHLAQAKAWAAR